MKLSYLANTSCFPLAFCILAAFVFSPANASTIIDPLSVISPQGDYSGDYALANIINQSGLSAGYTSGVTDFAAYVASVTHDGTGTGSGGTTSGFTGNNSAPPAQFSFDLGAPLQIDAIAYWDTDNPGSVTSFDLYADTDQDFGNGAGTYLGTFNPTAGGSQPSSAQVFTFSSVNTRYVHLEATSLATAGLKNAGIGEVAFRSGTVPIPAAAWLFGSGLMGLLAVSRRRRA